MSFLVQQLLVLSLDDESFLPESFLPSISLSFTLANVLPPETVTSKLSRETVRERAEDGPVKAKGVTP